MSTSTIVSITPAELAAILQKAGYRASLAEDERHPRVHSASQGIGFVIAFGNPAQGAAGRYLDFSFHCRIALQGDAPAGLVEQWNRNRRFARLYVDGSWLILAMDAMVAGGVSEDFVRAQVELWDHVLRDFVRHLQQPRPAAGQAAAAGRH